MRLPRTIAAAALAAGLTLAAPGTADAATCSISSGTYRKVATWGCGAVGWLGYPSNGGNAPWHGQVEDLKQDGPCTSVQTRTSPNSPWVTRGTDCYGGGPTGFSVSGPYGSARLVSGTNTLTLPVYHY